MPKPPRCMAGPSVPGVLRPQPEQPDQGGQDDGEFGPGLLAVLAREVLDGPLQDAGAPALHLQHQLG